MTNTQLHQHAIDTLNLIAENVKAIKACKDNLVLLQYDTALTASMKAVFIAQQHDFLTTLRDIKRKNVETYAEAMKRLVQPIIDKINY